MMVENRQSSVLWLPIAVAVLLLHGYDAKQEKNFAPVIQTELGPVRGLSVRDNRVHFYQGIRYARARRFAWPIEPEPWQEVYNATVPRDSCPQVATGKPDGGLTRVSEDCLFLNVWRPIDQDGSKSANRSVMAYIHGGAFLMGSIFEPDMYNGEILADVGRVVVVTFSYRLGPFGFLYADSVPEATGNQAFHDQIMALRWIQKNIHHFGGDPEQVTLFGESAGSMSAGALINSPLTDGLFHRVILQSGYPTDMMGATPLDRAWQSTLMMAERLHCNGSSSQIVECLRSKPFRDICDATPMENWDMFGPNLMFPVYGDDVVPVNPDRISDLDKRLKKKIDLLFGVTHDEGSMFIDGIAPELIEPWNEQSAWTMDKLKNIMERILQHNNVSDPQELIDFYSKTVDIHDYQSIRNAVIQLYGDFILACPTVVFGKRMAQIMAETGHRSYAYRVDQRVQLPPFFNCTEWRGVCHGSDLPLVFGYSIREPAKYPAGDQTLSLEVIRAWARFAKTGQPGTFLSKPWTEYIGGNSSSTNRYMSIRNDARMADGDFVDNCEHLWRRRHFK